LNVPLKRVKKTINRIINNKCITKEEYKEDIKERLDNFEKIIKEKFENILTKIESLEKIWEKTYENIKSRINNLEDEVYYDSDNENK